MEKERRICLLNKGDKNKHSHLIIIVDRSDYQNDQIIRYVSRKENIKDILFNYICSPHLEIWNIFNYDMDLESQINEDKPYHVNAPYNKINEAYKFALEKHNGQFRNNGDDYINHPIQVASLVKKYFKNHSKINELITAAYLHDTLEDTNTTAYEIKEKFGEYVCKLVSGVTNDEILKKEMGKTNYMCYKILNMDEDSLNLKLCDRLANILDLKNADENFIEKYIIETTIILNYLLTNKKITDIQIEIVKEINKNINDLRKSKILKLVNNK